jgi:hypothetical protein
MSENSSPALLAACATHLSFLVLNNLKCFNLPGHSKVKSDLDQAFPFLTLKDVSTNFLPHKWWQLYEASLSIEVIEAKLNEIIF